MQRTALNRAAATLALALAVTGLAGCGDDDSDVDAGGSSSVVTSASPTTAPTPAPVENAVTITGVDYGYTLDKPAVDSGTTKITFVNGGKDAHMLAFLQIAAGKTFADVQAVLKTEDRKDDGTVLTNSEGENGPFGTPEILTAGARTTTYTDLAAGSYALVCFFPTADGKPHFAAGMLAPFTVNAAVTTAVAPTPTGEATIADGKITIPDLSSGKALLKVSNTGKGNHNFFIAQIAAGKKFEDLVAVVDKYFAGQAKVTDLPGGFYGGVGAFKPGTSAFVELDLPPGQYAVICTEGEGEEEGNEHFRKTGEKVEFTVA